MQSRIPSRDLACTTLLIALLLGITPALLAQEPAAQPNPALLDPSRATATAPDTYRVKVETTAGDLVIEVNRDWAPRGADRFYNMVMIGYYDNAAFFRVIEGFMAQIGMHANPEVTAAWRGARIQDDPVVKSNTKGMVTFAMGAQPNTRTTQFFINLGNNSYLDQPSKFAPFGQVVEGFETVENLYDGYGEGAPRGKGPSQGRISKEGNTYLKADFPKLDYIVHASIVD